MSKIVKSTNGKLEYAYLTKDGTGDQVTITIKGAMRLIRDAEEHLDKGFGISDLDKSQKQITEFQEEPL